MGECKSIRKSTQFHSDSPVAERSTPFHKIQSTAKTLHTRPPSKQPNVPVYPERACDSEESASDSEFEQEKSEINAEEKLPFFQYCSD